MFMCSSNQAAHSVTNWAVCVRFWNTVRLFGKVDDHKERLLYGRENVFIMQVCEFMWVCVRVCECTYVCVSVSVSVCECVCMCVSVCVCECVCVCVYVCVREWVSAFYVHARACGKAVVKQFISSAVGRIDDAMQTGILYIRNHFCCRNHMNINIKRPA